MKQETLEEKLDKIVSKEPSKFFAESNERAKIHEAATNYSNKKHSSKDLIADTDWYEAWLGFRNGAKWQQEQSYSEEDMKSFGDWCRNGLLNTEYGLEKLDEHLEKWKQFKKR
jgi:hypothetical protein